jgi:DNA-binding NarL/FixJ family response regulator
MHLNRIEGHLRPNPTPTTSDWATAQRALANYITHRNGGDRPHRREIVVMTMQTEPAYARQALSVGALGYVLKEAAESELVEAVRRAAAGDTYLNPRLGARVAAEPPPGPPDGLSEREVDVLRMIALGHTNAGIAKQLYLSIRTVETHRAHVQQKLNLGTRARAFMTWRREERAPSTGAPGRGTGRSRRVAARGHGARSAATRC